MKRKGLQHEMDDLRIAWQDLGYAVARETRLLKLANRLGMKPRKWVLQAEQRRKVQSQEDSL